MELLNFVQWSSLSLGCDATVTVCPEFDEGSSNEQGTGLKGSLRYHPFIVSHFARAQMP